MTQQERIEEAARLLQQALELQSQGQLDEAIRLYQRSARLHPTAEAYTYMAWAMSFQGRIEEAIEHCRRAIAIDPDFGNPYNDIGSYLMRQGRMDEAIPWLEKATHAARYEPRHFPHINLARIHRLRGRYYEALAEVKHALKLQPKDVSIHKLRQELLGLLN
jgi:tetratricopeptide (TPR) repeat protein